MKNCRKICSLIFAKKIFSTKMAPEIRAKILRKSYVVHTTVLTFLGETTKNSCAHTAFCFLNFTNIIDYFEYKLFMKMYRITCHFIFSKKSVSPKWSIRLYCTDRETYLMVCFCFKAAHLDSCQLNIIMSYMYDIICSSTLEVTASWTIYR